MPALQAPCDGHRKTVTFVTFWKKCIDNHRHTWSLHKSCLQRRRRHGHWLAAAKQRGLRPFGSLRGTSGLDRTTESKRVFAAHHETDRLDNWTTSTTVTDVKTMIQCPCGPWIRYQNCFAYLCIIFGPFHFHCHVLLRGVQVADILDFVKTVLQFHKLERVDIGGRACVARFASCKMLQSSKDIPHPTSRYIWSHELQWVKDDPWQAPKEKCFHCQSRRPKVSKELQELKKLTLTHADSYYEHKIFGFVFF